MNNISEQPTFYFHDYETFGIHPAFDRPAQFAGLRTDRQLNAVDEPLVVYCKPADDYLPQPEAVLLTGITPQQALAQGVCEAEFARQIHAEFSQANTCIVGYNNIRFDDEVTRNIFYRNFYDAYAYSWQNNNSRWDLLDVVRAFYALRPENIQWPLREDGLPSFKLEHLTDANGLSHEHAHDAMSDVYATIAVAKLLKDAQPRLFNYLFEYRDKNKLKSLIDIVEMTPLVHVSGMFGAARSNISLISPLAWHPTNSNAVIVCDLAGDMTPLLTLSADELRERLYTSHSELAIDESPVPIKLVHINKCPVLAIERTLREDEAKRVGVDRTRCFNNLQLLKDNPQVREKVFQIFADQAPFVGSDDVDGQLYDGFFSYADKSAMQIILETEPKNLPALSLTFADPRMKALLFRFRARNYFETLTDSEQQAWLHHRQAVFTSTHLESYIKQLDELALTYLGDEEKCKLLQQLYHYAQYLVG